MQDSYFWNILFLHCLFPTHPRYCTSGLRDYNDDWSGGGNIANWSHGRGDLDTWPCQGLVRTLWTGLKQFFEKYQIWKILDREIGWYLLEAFERRFWVVFCHFPHYPNTWEDFSLQKKLICDLDRVPTWLPSVSGSGHLTICDPSTPW